LKKKQNVFSLIYEYSGTFRRFFVLAVGASLFSVIFSFLTPQIIRFTVDSVIGSEPMELPDFILRAIEAIGGRDALRGNILICSGAIVISALLSGVMNYFSRYGIARGAEGFAKQLRDKLYAHIQRLPFSWHTTNLTGDIIQRCTSDVETLRSFISAQFLEVVRTVLLIACALVLMFSMNTTLAIISAAFIPVIIIYSALFHSRISRQFRKADESEGDLMVDVQENLTGVRVVRAFGRERYERDKFEKYNDKFANDWIDLGYTLGMFWGVGDFVSCLNLLVIVCVGAYLAATGKMTLGVLLAFVSYTQTLAWPIRSLGRTLSELSKASVSADRILDILSAEPEADSDRAGQADMTGDIHFENVSFAYGAHEVIRAMDFTVKGGSTFGILGTTSSGKSTLTYLLTRLYELPDGGGRITIGGTDVRDIRLDYLRENVGLVLQEPFLFSKTVGENIAIAANNPTLEQIRAAASIADVDESIMSFPEGYDTVVGERGVTLSGGQKQRIAIARTLIKNCPILIFDDSTSAVDMETDARIRESLRENTAGATVILISHRINTLMQCDNILVMDEGRAVQQGTHAELIAQDGLYKRVYEIQSDAGRTGGANG
jgi:ATP-binding cassette subfamily B protein